MAAERGETTGPGADAGTRADNGSSTGLGSHLAGALTYLLGFVTGILFYLIEERDAYVRFHAVQSILVFGGLFVLSMLLGFVSTLVFPVPGFGPVLAAVLGTVSLLLVPVSVLLWLLLMYRAYRGERYALPWLGRYVERYV